MLLQVVYDNWAPGEPDGDNQDHGFLSDADGWMWGNELNTVEQFYLCEADYIGTPPTTPTTPTTTLPTTTSQTTTPPPGGNSHTTLT